MIQYHQIKKKSIINYKTLTAKYVNIQKTYRLKNILT